MGWFRRVFRRPRADPPPWVNPRFLSIAAGMGVFALGLALWQGPPAETATEPGQDHAATHREYVGFSYDEVAMPAVGFPPCWPDCDVAKRLDDWKQSRPDILILEVEPVHEHGVHVGYWVEYVLKEEVRP